ncbi:hypothetical protein [Paenibacillus sp. F4]|uniref:hypothetical protein n=1 Tax=Paenibacillus sp. F4 TaxID=357385 RepID=UPI000C9EEAD8|nr:hypothetical protein [Paenibacillus sp. F4]PNQ79836.1 hypothetical protein C1T21_17790 [Paenibacillus sp. F4]
MNKTVSTLCSKFAQKLDHTVIISKIGEILGDPLLLVGENHNQLTGYHMEMMHAPEGDLDSELETAHDIHVLATMAILTATDREQRPQLADEVEKWCRMQTIGYLVLFWI